MPTCVNFRAVRTVHNPTAPDSIFVAGTRKKQRQEFWSSYQPSFKLILGVCFRWTSIARCVNFHNPMSTTHLQLIQSAIRLIIVFDIVAWQIIPSSSLSQELHLECQELEHELEHEL